MNKSDDREIFQKTAIFPISENWGPQTLQNPTFLSAPDHENEQPDIKPGNFHQPTDFEEPSEFQTGKFRPSQNLTRSEIDLVKIRLAHSHDLEIIERWVYGKSEKTKLDYLRIAQELLDMLGDKSLRDVTESFIQSFVDLAKHKSPHTQKQRVAILKSLFKYACKKRHLTHNPADDLKSIEAHHKISERYLSQEEVFRMIDRTTEFRNRTVLKVLYGAGLRVSELVSLNWEAIQEREAGLGQLTVIGKRNKKRVVGLSSGVFQDLMKLKPENAREFDPVFVSREDGRLSVRQVHLIVRDAALRAGITRKVSPHWLRHCYASHALDRGCPLHVLQRDLGHSKLVTLGEYLKARPQDFGGKYLGV